jgi:hypothetical protein
MYNCTTNFMLNYLKNTEIDKMRWNELVSQSSNATIFCFSWYLDAFCSWNAIIFGDYEGAIALPIKKQGPFNVIYQPPFIQKCDWFGEMPKLQEVLEVEEMILSKVDYLRFNTNLKLFNAKMRPNYSLPLNNNIIEINAKYNLNLKRNLKKAQNALMVEANLDEVFAIYLETYGNSPFVISPEEVKLLTVAIQKNVNNFKLVKIVLDNKTVAIGIYVMNIIGKRIHYLLGAPTNFGRQNGAMAFMHNEFIKNYSSSDWVFDFEGSAIDSVARFYKQFAPIGEEFYEVEASPNIWFRGVKKLYKILKRS